MYNLHTCHHEVLFSWAHWIEMDGERGWNPEVTTTWLLRSFFAEVALWWAFTPNTNITVSIQKDIYILPIMFLPSPYWITQTITYCHKSEGIYISNYLSRQNEQLETLLQVLPTGRISFQHCTSESSLSMETVLQIYQPSDGTSIWCRTICKLGLSFFLPQSTGTPLKATGVGWEWRKEAWVWTTRYIKYSIIKGYKIIIGLLFLKKKKCAECTHKQKTSKRKFINILVVTPGWSNMGDLIFMFFCIEFFQ